MNMSLYQEPDNKRHYYTSVSLLSLLFLLTVVQLVSDQSLAAGETPENESIVVSNIMLSTNSPAPSEDFSPDSFPKVHTHMSGEAGIFVNGCLIETANGVVAIDSALTVSESRALKARLDTINKSLLAVLLTHPHPDHVAGVTYLVLGSSSPADVPVISLESVETICRSDCVHHQIYIGSSLVN